MREFPDVRVEFVLSDRFIDPIEEGFDVTLRIAEDAPSTSLIVRNIAPAKRVLCASPDYIASAGEPETPRELRRRRCLRYGYLDSGNQ